MIKRGPLNVATESKVKFCPETGSPKPSFKNFWVRDDNGTSVALFSSEYSMKEEEASDLAHLLAAAPEMYEALADTLAMLENADHEPDLKEVYAVTVGKIESSLRKARGGS